MPECSLHDICECKEVQYISLNSGIKRKYIYKNIETRKNISVGKHSKPAVVLSTSYFCKQTGHDNSPIKNKLEV